MRCGTGPRGAVGPGVGIPRRPPTTRAHAHAVPRLQAKDMDKLQALGGVEGLAKAIGSSETAGLDAAESSATGSVGEHSRVFGPNKYKEVPSKNFFALCYENLKDPIILLLIAAALVRAPRAPQAAPARRLAPGRPLAAPTLAAAPAGGSGACRAAH